LKCRREPRLVTMRLLPKEVRFLNDTVQVYARDYLFFRSERPEINSDFSRHEHRQYERHHSVWLDSLIDAVTQFQPR